MDRTSFCNLCKLWICRWYQCNNGSENDKGDPVRDDPAVSLVGSLIDAAACSL